MTTRVLLADDHPVYLEGLRMLLDTVEGIEVVGAASDGACLLELAERVAADVAVIDLDMPYTDGASAAAALRGRMPVLILTMHGDQAHVAQALRAGARGYILKSAGPTAIARAIIAVAEGDTVLAGAVGERVRDSATRSPSGGPLAELTARETEVLDLVARGLSNAQIGQRLFLSVKTIGNHVSAILAKLDLASRAEAVARARDAGLGEPES
ncbi:response regulator transcription factor [Nonomuraea sp. M3C6]|jgi:DNA-binding NarL/FixJ family response regulator|uniref:Response regulator transcription factor n=1 Tax=Nonomuraea marmarensis TaxID=3351344 RepID=A0ABW7AR71_9ACTN